MLDSRKFDVFFATFGGSQQSSVRIDQYLREARLRDRVYVVPISRIGQGDLPALIQRAKAQSKTLLVVNDLLGVLPQMHAMADLAFISGHVNQFEPLNAGTPTLIVTNPRFSTPAEFKEYEKGYAPQVQVAEATGHAKRFFALEPALKEIDGLLAGGRVPWSRRPFALSLDDSNSAGAQPGGPLDRFLEHLAEVLGPQLPSAKKKSAQSRSK